MRRYLVLIRIVVAVAVLALTASTLNAEESRAPIGFNALTLTIEIPSRHFLSLEPIPVRLVLENRTGQPVMGHTILRFYSGRARLLVQPDRAQAYTVDDLSALSAPMAIGGQTIQPGERHEVTDVLAIGLDRMFSGPGNYRFQVVLAGPDRRVEVRSNVVSIRIREATGLDEAARAYIVATGAARYFLTSMPGDDDSYSHLEEFAALFPDTAYAGYADLILGEAHVAREEHDGARVFLSRAAANANFPLAAHAAQRLQGVPRQ